MLKNEIESRIRLELTHAHKTFFGIGPGRVCSHIAYNVIWVRFERCLTSLERNLAIEGNIALVHDIRRKMFDRFQADTQIEQFTGAKMVDSVFRVRVEEDAVYAMLIFDRQLPLEELIG